MLDTLLLASLLFAPQADTPPELPRFAAPVRIEAGGKPIVAVTGHAAPFLVDLDGDGKRDLVVGMFGNDGNAKGGTGRLYKNIGSDTDPRFDTFEVFTVDGVPASMESS